ncbi:MAG: hypothetical protein J7604_23855 [Sporocytophaga sp.]|uniref:hypothetical protein n=1 Tax=Sporocytophaga sp. TaxID=2231183 RepID=UPI001AFF1CAF|nr:hypothetical protein [Sporocytophaga sp.]MBO9703271.1 hypothetical protein [Sporocytophaga sp.]
MVTSNPNSLRFVFNLLKYTFVIVPILAGLDKFTNILTNWEHYLNPSLEPAMPFSPQVFMMIVGVIEIIAGVIVLIKPQLGGLIVAAWLTLIAISLITDGQYFDVAVRDLVMAIAAFSMARIASIIKQ